MADKVIVLKDPFTGDRLFPVCSSKSIIDENGNSFDISKYLTQETASTLYAAKTHTHEIANINGLQTELDNLKTSVSEGKSLIAAAVTDKGVQTAADATFQQMATNIGNIQTGPGTVRVGLHAKANSGSVAGWTTSATYTSADGSFKTVSMTSGETTSEFGPTVYVDVLHGGVIYAGVERINVLLIDQSLIQTQVGDDHDVIYVIK